MKQNKLPKTQNGYSPLTVFKQFHSHASEAIHIILFFHHVSYLEESHGIFTELLLVHFCRPTQQPTSNYQSASGPVGPDRAKILTEKNRLHMTN
jgi:hypothetical protein